jgi:hypothetical protein
MINKDKWWRFTYVCDPDECDTLTEVITPSANAVFSKCFVCGRMMTLVSVGDGAKQ